MDRMRNGRIRGLCGVLKSLDVRISEGMLLWFGQAVRIEDGRIINKDIILYVLVSEQFFDHEKNGLTL